MLDNHALAATVQTFIDHPTERSAFNHFYEAAFHIARGYLRHLTRRGFRLPLDEYSAEGGLTDCTTDCLAPLFASRPGHPCHLIVDYFKGKIEPDTPADRIAALLHGLIAGHVHQELFRMKASFAPQQARLKRRLRAIMTSDEYCEFRHDSTRCWTWRRATQPPRSEQPLIGDNTLSELVLAAVQTETHMPDRCREVFSRLDNDDRFVNAIPAHRLIAAMVQALTRCDDAAPSVVASPQAEFVRRQIDALSDKAIDATIQDCLMALAAKRGLTAAETESLGNALRDLMADFCADGDHDPLPQYAKARLNAHGADWNLKRHKYIWETVVADCKERLREDLIREGLNP
jgi:hypothetical protein